MKSITVEGKTVNEAIQSALLQLGATENEVEIEVLQEENAGFFGIGSKDAKVKVSLLGTEDSVEVDELSHDDLDLNVENVEEDYEVDEFSEVNDDEHSFEERIELAAKAIEDFLNEVLDNFELDGENKVSVEVQENKISAEITGDDCGILIGRKGVTLRAIQYIASLVANKTAKTKVRFVLDIGRYKARHKENVAELAKRTAERAISTGQAFELTPMSAADRRVVHSALNDFPGVITYSEGEEPRRYVVIDLDYIDEENSDFEETEEVLND